MSKIFLLSSCLFFSGRSSSTPNSINETIYIKSNGINQFLSIRGKSVNLPVLLFIHGGPGFAMTPLVQKINKNLEESFIVVSWDQRGAGKSSVKKLSSENLSYPLLIDDCKNISEFICQHFHKEKIYIVGHSVGSVIGIQVVQKYPSLFHAFISVSQVVNKGKSDLLSYNYVKQKSLERGDLKRHKQIERLSILPNGQYQNQDDYDIQRKILTKYNGLFFSPKVQRKVMNTLIFSKEYGYFKILAYLRSYKDSQNTMRKELYEFDMSEKELTLEVPTYFIVGKHDQTTNTQLSSNFFHRLQCPRKKLIWFEESAHMAPFEEPEQFLKILLEITKENK